MKYLVTLLLAGLLVGCSSNGNDESKGKTSVSDSVAVFLEDYNKKFQELLVVSAEASWKSQTMMVEGDTITGKLASDAEEAMAIFTGSKANIETSKRYLELKDQLTPIQVRQLEAIYYMAGAKPEVAGEVVRELIEAGVKQSETLYSYKFMHDTIELSVNDIDSALRESNDINARLDIWEISKGVGKELKSGLQTLQKLRNESVRALGFKDYFEYQVAEYGMTGDELRKLTTDMIKDIWPLYRELHTYARYELAKKFNQPVPEMLPAHWLPNRWGQDWASMVEVKGLDLDKALADKSAEWVVKEGEKFYMSVGFDALPQTFYEKSSLYPLPAGTAYKKNTHASAWHIDNDKDVRSLMSVAPNTQWWGTALHELGHIYYFMTYSNDSVPIILRAGANRGYHEAMGTLIGLAATQKPFLEHVNLLEPGTETDDIAILLQEAMNHIVVIPWGSGVMTEFEHELYANELKPDQYNAKWWELKKKYQGIVPPNDRLDAEGYCDAATKTHINDDAAQYYDYTISTVLLFQFHDHIATKILKQDPHSTNYYGNKEVGEFLKRLMRPGATKDWNELLQEELGTGMSAKPMVNYFAPLMEYLKEVNKDREHTLPETI